MNVATLLDAQIAVLNAHSWTAGTAPTQVLIGPIPPVLAWPVVGVMAVEGDDGNNDLARDLENQTIYWTTEIPVDPVGAHYRTLLAIDEQMRALILANSMWGLGDDVHDTYLRGWTTAIGQQETGGQLLQTMTRRMEVQIYDR